MNAELSRKVQTLDRGLTESYDINYAIRQAVDKTASAIDHHFLAFKCERQTLTDAILLCFEKNGIKTDVTNAYSRSITALCESFDSVLEQGISQQKDTITECEEGLKTKRSKLSKLKTSLADTEQKMADSDTVNRQCERLREEANELIARARSLEASESGRAKRWLIGFGLYTTGIALAAVSGGLSLLAVGTVTHLAGSATLASTLQWNSSISCQQEAEKRLAEALKLERRLFEFEADILLYQTQIEQLEKDITETEQQIAFHSQDLRKLQNVQKMFEKLFDSALNMRIQTFGNTPGYFQPNVGQFADESQSQLDERLQSSWRNLAEELRNMSH